MYNPRGIFKLLNQSILSNQEAFVEKYNEFNEEKISLESLSLINDRNNLFVYFKELLTYREKLKDDKNYKLLIDFLTKKSFFKINELTDVIAFRLNDYSEENVEGEVYISVERVFYNAKKFNEKKTNEISRILIHGILHLLNYKDDTNKGKNLMTEKENYYLAKIDCECFNV